VAHLIDLNQRFDLESKSAAEMQTELGHIDDVLAKTFDSLPDDLSAAFTPSGTVERTPGPTGVWNRLLRLLGLGGDNKTPTPDTALNTP
jgi:hypothetical protein